MAPPKRQTAIQDYETPAFVRNTPWTSKPQMARRQMMTKAVTASDVLKAPQWPTAWPYTPEDFKRSDEENDGVFYETSRLCYHIDESAVAALTSYYATVIREFEKPPDVLDICSSWVSHYPDEASLGRVSGVGMNEFELSKNPRLTDFIAKDLNVDPKLPYEDETFDLVTCVVSVDYLNKPRAVFEEINRVLRPGGVAVMSCSNRCFPTKAIQLWLQTNDLEHVFIVGSFFHYAGGFEPPSALDISPNPGRSDPLYIIRGTKADLS